MLQIQTQILDPETKSLINTVSALESRRLQASSLRYRFQRAKKNSIEKELESAYHQLDEIVDKQLVMTEKIEADLAKMDISSSKDREQIKNLYHIMIESLKVMEPQMDILKDVVKDQVWIEKLHGKYLRLTNLIEDVSETCALVLSDEFVSMIQNEIQILMDDAEED